MLGLSGVLRGSDMKIAFVCPDDLSIMLFGKGIIAALKSIPSSEVHAICNMAKYRDALEKLGCIPVEIGAYRFFDPVRDLNYAIQLHDYFRKNKIDIVFNFATKQNIYGTVAARFAGVEQIVSYVVGRGTAFGDRNDFKGFLLQRTVSMLYRLVGSWSNKIWFTNASDLKYFIDSKLISSEKTVLSRNYLDVWEYSADKISEERIEAAKRACRLNEKETVVIMVARMIWAKGIREFTEAAMLLNASHPHLKFVLVAPLEDGSYGAVSEEYVREFEHKANFSWVGFQEDVKAFYFLSQLAVLPSYYMEGGYPRALLEPMAMGKPIITTDTDGCRDTVEDGLNGFLIPPRDAVALAERIAEVVDDDVLRTKMGQYSQLKALRDFDEQQIVPDVLRRMGLPIPTST